MNIAFLGLGAMGLPMARNLLRAGHALHAWNRTRDKVAALEADGARVASSPADAVQGVEMAISMLADDRAALDVALGDAGLLAALREDAVHVSMSTIGLDTVRALEAAHAAAGRALVSAPVFGRPAAAAAAKLLIVAAGPGQAVERCRPAFDALGQGTFVVGDDPAQANVVKLTGNFLIASAIESLGEAVALLRKAGVDPGAVMGLLTNTLFASPIHKTYSEIIVGTHYSPPGFAMPLGLKDMGLVLEAARLLQVPMPTASLVRDGLVSGLARGLGHLDWSAVAEVRAWDAGLPPARGV
jgi:3-hydroxyisobutyrate dehydrogenase-like beta-hydroxyacid dehydrogenase